MYDAFNINAPSPDGRHRALLAFSGEVRFGPAYYVLAVDEHPFGERIFGDAHLWSPSSDLLAVQEWLTLDYSAGPITALVIIDVVGRREVTVARATKRFLVPEGFQGATLTYREDHAGGSARFELDTTAITDWQAFS
jgi:hypothetical protein